jgi:hypothetical protein
VLKRGERLTGDIEVENIVIIGRIVYQLPASLIHNQDFPFTASGMTDRVKDNIALDVDN